MEDELKNLNIVMTLAYKAIKKQDFNLLYQIEICLKKSLANTKKDLIQNLFLEIGNLFIFKLANNEFQQSISKEIFHIIKHELNILKYLKKNFNDTDSIKNLEKLNNLYNLVEYTIKIHLESYLFASRNNNIERSMLETIHLDIINEMITKSNDIILNLKK